MPLALSTSKLNFCKSSRARTRSSVVVSTRIQAFTLIVRYPKVLLSTLNFKMQIPDSTGAVQYPSAPGATLVASLILSSFLVLQRTFVEERLQMSFVWSRSVGQVHWLAEELKEPEHESKQSSPLYVQTPSHCLVLHHLHPFKGSVWGILFVVSSLWSFQYIIMCISLHPCHKLTPTTHKS